MVKPKTITTSKKAYLITRLFNDLQITDLKTTDSIVRNLKGNLNGTILIVILNLIHSLKEKKTYAIISSDRGETKVSSHMELSHTIKLFNSPQ